jgi:DNA-binding MarR family transcriptional regulator
VKDPGKIKKGDIIKVQPVSVAILTEPKKIILQRLEDCGGAVDSQRELGSRADLKASSISKHLNDLEDAGYIIRIDHGRKTRVEITNLGRIVFNLKTFRQENIWSR